jgi:hypothetical protein
MTTLKVFFSKAPTTGYVFKTGRAVHFVNHKYATTIKSEIAELTEECQLSESNYHINPHQLEIDFAELDPIAVIKAKALAEARAEVAAATQITRDMGATDQTAKLSGIANTSDVSGATIASGTDQQNIGAAVTATAIKVGALSTATATATKR